MLQRCPFLFPPPTIPPSRGGPPPGRPSLFLTGLLPAMQGPHGLPVNPRAAGWLLLGLVLNVGLIGPLGFLRYRLANRALRELLRPYKTDPIGKTWSEIAGPETAAVVEQQDRAILATGESMHMEQGWTGPDGRPIIALAQKVPLKDEDGRVVGIITCGIDITRLKKRSRVWKIRLRVKAAISARCGAIGDCPIRSPVKPPCRMAVSLAQNTSTAWSIRSPITLARR